MDKQMKLKQMLYTSEGKLEVLCDGEYKGYRFFIVSHGTHPCACVALPETSRFYGKNYKDEIFYDLNFYVHGGLNYSGRDIYGTLGLEWGSYIIEWSYDLYTDFMGLFMHTPHYLLDGKKKWTTEEICEEVKVVIDEIIREEAEND